jgi:hypothetical protein
MERSKFHSSHQWLYKVHVRVLPLLQSLPQLDRDH